VQVIISSALEQGLIYCFMVLGVFLTFRVLDFPDLTVDGSLPLGAAVTGALIVGGQSPLVATVAGVGAGLCAGLVTASCICFSSRGRPTPPTTGPSCSPAFSR
jgi:putative ABC transport system permease protein